MSTEIAPGLLIQNLAEDTATLRLSDYKLIAFDMDSTLITIECIDEIADVTGKKAEVAAITEATMRGEIADFKDSLRQRVAKLRGVTQAQMLQVRQSASSCRPVRKSWCRQRKKRGLKSCWSPAVLLFLPNTCAAC